MSVKLRLVDPPTECSPRAYAALHGEPGDCFRWPDYDADGREAWCIVLPNGAGIWATTTRSTDPPHELWDVSGEPPNLTVHPSINAGDDSGRPGNWHGWIKNGEMAP